MIKGWHKQAAALAQKDGRGLHVKASAGQAEAACLAEDLKHRAQLQNKLAGSCEDMCKEVGAYPKCACPDFVPPDSTPGVMTWDELLEHMDNLSYWGHDQLKGWKKQASPETELMQQDPCAGCDTTLALAYQKCAMVHGNPCAEKDAAGLVISGPGQKKDVACCMKKEKHDRCMQCATMDCAYKTCNVNKKYYNTYTTVEKFDDVKAMKQAGWGK